MEQLSYTVAPGSPSARASVQVCMVLVHRPVPAVGAPVGGRAREPSQQKTKAVFLFF